MFSSSGEIVSKVVIFHETCIETDKMSRLIKGFHFAWFCHVIFIFFLIPSILKVKLVYKTKIKNYLSKFSIWNVCHDYHVNLCLTMHELFELPHGILTLNYVVHISIITFSVSIDVYCSACLSVLQTKQCYTVYTFRTL